MYKVSETVLPIYINGQCPIIKTCSDVTLNLSSKDSTRGEFNNASARRALVDWYLSLFIMCNAGHQYNERPRALALLNLPLVQYYATMYYNHLSMRKVHLVNGHVVYV